jgi:hypothetical protein
VGKEQRILYTPQKENNDDNTNSNNDNEFCSGLK